jgi:hypothetical protein
MTNQEIIVSDCACLSRKLNELCIKWLHTGTNRRAESAGHELASAADALYSFINSNSEIMGSNTGRPAFDEPTNPDFQEDMQSLWDQEEPDYRELKRLRNEAN